MATMSVGATVEVAAEGPRTRKEAEAVLAEIGEQRRALERIQGAMNEKLARAKQAHEVEAEPHRARLAVLEGGLRRWADEHREELLAGGAKTAKLTTGMVRWKKLPDRVVITGKIEAVISRLKKAGLRHLVTTREDVNRAAIKADPAAVRPFAAIRVQTGEEVFVAVPFAADLAPD